MLKRKDLKRVFSSALVISLLFQYIPEGVYAKNGVEVNQDSEKISIENEYISREFSIHDDILQTTSLVNKRIGETLIPQTGSEDFLINTIVPVEDTDVNPVREIDRSTWKGHVTGQGSSKEIDAKNLFDGDDKTETEYYDTSTNFPYVLTVDLGKEETFKSFSFQKRVGNSNPAWGINGTIGEYELQVSTDGSNWLDAGSGEFTREDYNLHVVNGVYNVADLVYANFDQEYTAQYVRLITKSCSLSSLATFCGAEFRLYEDAYVKAPEQQTEIKTSDLKIENIKVDDIDAGKKLVFEFEPYEFNDINWDINYIVVMENEDHFMRSYLETKVDQEEEAKIDYIDLDHFELSEDTKGVWSRPDDFKVNAGAYSFQETEMLLGQPIYAQGMFFGSEFPATDTKVDNNQMQIRYYSGKTLKQLREENKLTTDGKMVTWPNVVGAAQGTEMDVVQTDFFSYIDSIATKTDFRKQYNSWYDNRMAITDESIEKSFFGSEKGLAQNGIEPLDSYVVDDGWNNYNDPTYTGIDEGRSGLSYNQTGFWEFNDKFPNEFYTAKQMAANFDSSFGVWLGPQGGYELQGTFSQYIESSDTGYVHPTAALGKVICTGSKKYIQNLTTLFTDYQERFDIDYWKLDGFASRPCVQEDHDHMVGGYNNMYFTSDLWESWTDTFEAMRAQRVKEGKGLFINATCYVNPSPWMLQWVNTVWMQNAGDNEFDSTNGGTSAQRMISGRDNIYFTNVRTAQLQFPLKNIYNHDPIYGVSANVTMTTDEFRQYLMSNAVRGTAFWELYFSPSIMDEQKWQVTADVLEFTQNNYHILKNAKLFGNAPKQKSVYGYSSWNNDEGIVSFRNPTNTTKTYTLTLNNLVGVPTNMENLRQTQILPYTSEISNQTVSYGDEVTVTLEPYQTIIYQYGLKDTEVPAIEYVKNIDENTIRIKFNKRIEDANKFTVNGKKADEANILADYHTIEIKTSEELIKDSNIDLEIDNLKGLNGVGISKTVSFKAYQDYIISKVENNDDLVDGAKVETQTFNRNEQQLLKLDNSYKLNTSNVFDSNTKDYSISMLIQTSDKNSNILKQDNGYTLSIDKEGYVVYQDATTTLSSKQNITTVVEKANGRFGTESYVPTSTVTEETGKVNDGNLHYITVTRELNGMVKMYIDGELATTSYQQNEQIQFNYGEVLLGDSNFNANVGDIQVLNRALGYDEIKQQYNQYQLADGDIKLDKTAWQATADSVETGGPSNEGPAQYAIDDNPSTFWHTQYLGGKPECPHWLKIDLNDSVKFDKLEYISRNGNGSIRDYTIEISDDSENWHEINSGTMKKDGTTMIEFENTITARYLRININSSYGTSAANENIFGAIAEISLYKNKEALTDYSNLSIELQKAKELNENEYTSASYKELLKAMNEAKDVLYNVNATQEEVDNAITVLQEAKEALVKAEETAVSKTALQIAVEMAGNVTEEQLDKVVPAVVTEFNAALAEARVILANNSATQEQVDASFARLSVAMHMLEFLKGDKTELQDLVDSTADLVEGNYTEGSWSALQEALTNANTVLNNENAMQEEVDETITDLQAAINGLEEVEVVDKSLLEAMVNKVLGLEEDKYIESTWNAMLPDLEAAQEVLGNEKATQTEVDEACDALTRAYLNLRLKPNKDLLSGLINKANGLNSASYTAKTWAVVENEVMKAQAVLENPEASEAEVNAAHAALTKALEGLVAKPGDTTAIKTGDNSLIGTSIALMSLSLARILYFKKEKVLK
ncbi:sialidase [Thomasclavelia cocleata]|nr:discoidin domain-containing protein [Thomasclavelia cocleata]MCR1960587.1 discoidin domain-containing protein [Thomasclavelia cocleata]NDO41278.1 sialidase [Thomasclavelia cocleata]PJN80333.1 sialidase [Thomasclavelia cocleata]